ncbi:MAG TPA: metal transporter, partial [Flavobacterium sp.]|nr:metal transporter [Flavobacterium sp.]
MKNILLGMMLLFVTLSTQAQEKKKKNAKYDIEVNGNCEMCKKRIE